MSELRYLGRILISRGHIFVISLALAYASLGLLPASNSATSTSRATPPKVQILSEASTGPTKAASDAHTSSSTYMTENTPSTSVVPQNQAQQSTSTTTQTSVAAGSTTTTSPSVSCIDTCAGLPTCAYSCEPQDPPHPKDTCGICGSGQATSEDTLHYPKIMCPMCAAY